MRLTSSTKTLTQWAGISLLVAVVISPFAIARGGDSFADIARTPLFHLSFVITMAAAFLLMLAFAALWSERGAEDRVAGVGFTCGLLGAVLLFAVAWAIVAIIPTIADAAPNAIDPPPGSVFVTFAAIGFLWLVFALVLWTRRLFSKTARVLVTLAALLGIGPLLPVGLAVMGVALMVISKGEPSARTPRSA